MEVRSDFQQGHAIDPSLLTLLEEQRLAEADNATRKRNSDMTEVSLGSLSNVIGSDCGLSWSERT